MNKILRYSFMALLAMLFGNVMADTDVTFTFNTTDGISELGFELPAAGKGTKVESIDKGGVHIDAGTEGTRAVCSSTQASLDLYAGNERSERRNVYPEDLLGLGVIQGDSVESDVNLGALASTDCHCRIAKARAAFVVGYHGRQQVKRHRN